jgi:hypothetical protein
VELSIKKDEFGMENKSDKERLLSLIESEILKKNINNDEKEKIRRILKKVVFLNSDDVEKIGDEVIDIIGSNHMGVYYYENIWIIELLMKMLEYSENSNKIRSIFILSILNDLFYFEIEDNKNIDISEFEKEKTKIKEKLYKYSDDFFDELIKKYKNLNN